MHRRIIYWKPVRRGRAFFLLLGLVISIAAACGHRRDKDKGFAVPPAIPQVPCIAYDFQIDSLPYDRLPNTGYPLSGVRDTSYPRDADGVSLFPLNGRFYYHPVDICHKAYAFLDAYHKTGDRHWLEMARLSMDRLIKESVLFDSAVYFPYRFDYKVNQKDEGLLRAPWFSGMAQGEALGVLSRLFLATDDSSYLTYARKTFNSLTRLASRAEPWAAFIDSRGCFWIEEYPLRPPSMTLNGFIYGLYGVYDYYELTKDPLAENMLKDSFSTIKNYIPIFRRPGQPSFYGLRLGHYSLEYHRAHIQQLQMLGRITGDSYFKDWADSLKKDAR